MKRLLLGLILAALPLLSGCASLDFGGADGAAWQFRPGWNQAGVSSIGEEDPENPGFDKDGNLIPDNPEIATTYQFPDTTAGYALTMGSHSRTTPIIGIEAFEFKVPYLRWFSVQAQAGDQLLGVYVGKRFTSIYEITAGPWWGRDQETNEQSWGLAFTLIKF
jgi:hypothetical protein